MKRYLVQIISVFILVTTALLFYFINKVELILISVFLSIIFMILVDYLYTKSKMKKLNEQTENKDLSEIEKTQIKINFFENNIKNVYSNRLFMSYKLELAALYLLNDEPQKTIEIFNKYKNLKSNSYTLYIQIILNLAKNNLDEAIKLNTELQKRNIKILSNQKEIANKLIECVKNNIYNEQLYEKTTYNLVKRILLRIKNNTTEDLLPNIVVPTQEKNQKLSTIFIVLSIVSLFVCLNCLNIIATIKAGVLPNIMQNYYQSKYIWILYIGIIIPVAGFIYYCIKPYTRKAKISGTISLIFIIIFIMFSYSIKSAYVFNNDEKNINKVEEILNIEISPSYVLNKVYVSENTKVYYQDIKYETYVEMNEDNFEDKLNSNFKKELTNEETMLIFISEEINESDNYYYCVYCLDTKQFFDINNSYGKEYIVIIYSKTDNYLLIKEFKCIDERLK